MGKEGSELKSKKKVSVWVYIIIAAVLVTVIALTVMIISGATPEKRAAGKLERAERYMTALEYEEAIVLYKEAIEIDPKNIEAYKGLFNAYIKCEEEDEAADVLEEMEELLENLEGSEKKSLAKAIEKMRSKLGIPAEDGDDKSSAKGEKKGEAKEAKEAKSETVEHFSYRADGTIDFVDTFENGDKLVKTTFLDKAGNTRYWKSYGYNSDGRLEEVDCYGPNGETYDGVLFSYDTNGNCIKEDYFNPDGTMNHTVVNEYNVAGTLAKSYNCYSDGSLNYVDEYDAGAQLAKRTYYYADNSVYYVVKYDFDGKIIELDDYSGASVSDYYWEYEYDSNNSITEKYIYRGTDSTNGYTWSSYKYDSEGRLIRRQWGGTYDVMGDENYEYDSWGNLVAQTSDYMDPVKLTYDENGYIKSMVISEWTGTEAYFEQDAKGNLLKTTEKYIDGGVIAVGEYDYNGNLVKLTNYDSKGNVSGRNAYTYNARGQEILRTYYKADGSFDYSIATERDAKGLFVRGIECNADGSVRAIRTYDNYGGSGGHTVSLLGGFIPTEYDKYFDCLKGTSYVYETRAY